MPITGFLPESVQIKDPESLSLPTPPSDEYLPVTFSKLMGSGWLHTWVRRGGVPTINDIQEKCNLTVLKQSNNNVNYVK